MKKISFKFKLLSVVMAVVLCLPCLAFSAFADTTGRLAISSTQAEAGELFTVSVSVVSNPGIAGMKIYVSFDNNYITPVSVRPGNALSSSVLSSLEKELNPASVSSYTAMFYGIQNNYNTGTFFVLTFKAKDVAEDVMTYISVVCDDDGNTTNQDLETVVFSGASAKINVSASEDKKEEDKKDEEIGDKANIDLKRGASMMPYMAGYSDGTFKPTQAATRYEVVECFAELFTVDLKVDFSVEFKDVDAKHKAMVRLFSAAGVINGYPSDNTFRGTKTITRAEFCKIVTVLLDLDIKRATDQGFNDVKSHWAKDYINICAREGLVQGKGEGRFDPDGQIKRCEVATLINRITGAKAGTSCIYSDVPADAWYFGAVAAAAK